MINPTPPTRHPIATLAAVLMIAGANLAAQPLPNAATVLERYIEVTGGRAAYETHRNEILAGTIEFPAQGLKGSLTRYAAPGQEYSLMELDAIGTIEAGISHGVAWEKSVILGPRIKQGEEKEQSIREARFNSPLYWRQLYSKAEVAGKASINGEDCYEVLLAPPSWKPEHQFYSTKTGLLLRTTATAASQMGDVEIQVDLSDYKRFGGVLMPTRSQQKAGTQELIITVNQVRVNEPIAPAKFELPAEIAALLTKTEAPQAPH